MQLDSEDLLARIRRDWPQHYELSRLSLLVDQLQAENDELRALAAQPDASLAQTSVLPVAGFAAVARPYALPTDDDGARHGG